MENKNTTDVQAIPADYNSVTPFIIVKEVPEFIDFLSAAFRAEERFRVDNGDGTIGHAEVKIGNSILMMFDAKPDWPETPSFFNLYVENCDEVHQRALDAGATIITELSNNAWGDRGSRIRDPFGNIWWIQTHIEDISEEEIVKRMGEQKYIDNQRISTETLDKAVKSINNR